MLLFYVDVTQKNSKTLRKITLNYVGLSILCKNRAKKIINVWSAVEQKETVCKRAELGMLLCVILSVLLTHLHILNTLTFVSAVFLLAEVYLDACDCVWHVTLGDMGQTLGSAGIIKIDHSLLFLQDWLRTCSSTQVSCLAGSRANMCCLREGGSLNSTFNWQPPEPEWIILPDLLVALKHGKKCHAL